MAYDPPRRTLAARLEDRDRDRFAGRGTELAFLDRCMRADPPASVVHICGPGGIGKSALLRATARQARARGWEVLSVDGRELGPASGALETLIQAASRGAQGLFKGSRSGPLILIDSYERMTALDGYLRRDLLPTLPERTLVVIAGRSEPDPGWFSGGWETVTARLELHGLDQREALTLLAGHGLSDERVPAIIDWAGGSPLALSLAAETASADSDWNAHTDLQRPEVLRSLIHRLAHAELRDVRMSALCIAAIARTTTPQLLSAVLPRGEGEAAYQQLCDLTIAEPLGDGVTLHELVRKALLVDLRLRNLELERFLRRRIIDYLYERATDDEPLLMIDMAHLVDNPVAKWGFGWEGDTGFRIDSVREFDADRLEQGLRVSQNVDWWHLTKRFFAEAPDRVAVVRDLKDNIRGYLACVSLATAPAFAASDPLIGPWLAHARKHADQGDSVIWHAAVDFTGHGKVQAMLGVAGVLRCGIPNPRFAYLPIDRSYPGAVAFATAIGAEHLIELDVQIGGMVVECYRLDYGPGGLLAFLRSQVYTELGLTAPDPSTLRPTTPGQAGLGRIAPNLIGVSRVPATASPGIGAPVLSATGSYPAEAFAAGSPAAGSPAAGSPAAGSPAAGSPAAGSPAAGSPAAGSPAAGSPAAGSPAAGSPAAGSPAAGSSAAGSPAAGSPGTGSFATGSSAAESFAAESFAAESFATGSFAAGSSAAESFAAESFATGSFAAGSFAAEPTPPGQPVPHYPRPGRPVNEATTVPALPITPGELPGRRTPVADLLTVREALKNFRVPRDLARSPLAVGETVAERAESVRRLINEAAGAAFGDNENEKLLYSVLVAGYLQPMRSHEEAANKLCLSRAAYFRRLRTAVERLAEHLSEQLAISAAK